MMRKKRKIRLDVNFFIIALAVAAGVYVALLDSGKYLSGIDLLLIPKNEKTAIQIDKIRNNLVHIFDRKNGETEAEIKFRDSDSILSIEARNYIKSEAMDQVEKTAREIINTASLYYDVKSDLDIRIIRGETRKTEVNVFAVVLAGILAGAMVSFVIQIFLNYLEDLAHILFKKRKRTSDASRVIESMLMKNRAKIEKLSGLPARDYASEKPSEEMKQEEAGYFKKAVYPHNLPFEEPEESGRMEKSELAESVPRNLPFQAIEEPEDNGQHFDENMPEASREEPTEEEYKRRLNQLLKGE